MSTSFLTAIAAASRVTYLVVLVLGMALCARHRAGRRPQPVDPSCHHRRLPARCVGAAARPAGVFSGSASFRWMAGCCWPASWHHPCQGAAGAGLSDGLRVRHEAMLNLVIQTEDLGKRYGDVRGAVDHLSAVAEGEVYAFLG